MKLVAPSVLVTVILRLTQMLMVVVPMMLGGMPSLALADNTADAKGHFLKGSDFYKQARYQEAITEFQTAYKLRPAAVLHYNIAQCYEKLGDIPSALRAYHEYLHEDPKADDRVTVEAAMSNLEKRLQEKGVQQLLVYSEPPEAQVTIDGTARGTTPTAVELPAGKHHVEVSLVGFQPSVRDVLTTVDKSVELDFGLKKIGDVPLVSASDNGSNSNANTNAGDLTQKPHDHDKDSDTETPSKPRLWTWVAAGVTGLALASAIVVGVSAQSQANTLRDGTLRNHNDNQGLVNSAQGQATASTVLYVTAGVAGAGTIGLFFIEGRF
jgi:hypothetical protein